MLGSDVRRIEILPATLRDVSFIAANLCPEDAREIECQFPPMTSSADVARVHYGSGGQAWVTILDRIPVQCFGVIPSTPAGNVLIAWAFGTKQRRRAIPAVTRWMRAQVPSWIAAGVTRVEARAIVGHDGAARWLGTVKADAVPLPRFGRNGEDFVLYSWTANPWSHERNVEH